MGKASGLPIRRAIFALSLAVAVAASLPRFVPILSAQQVGIPATAAFAAGCSDQQLGGVTIDFEIGSLTEPSPHRLDPEWAAIITDVGQSILGNPPQILEGLVSPQQNNEKSSDQAHAEVAEEDISWTHYTHDYTFKVIPDGPYQKLLAYFLNADGSTTMQQDMEVEWDNASLMDEHEGFQRIWGAVPEFVWPAIGDRVWVEGRWIFDCGHPGSADKPHVRFETEIHPPRALVTFRLNHVALDSFPRSRTSAPNFPGAQSYLPVTGEPRAGVLSTPTQVPVTEADVFVSGNGGGANDVCSLVPKPCSDHGAHTGPIIPVNDRNYVFDIYPPGTHWGSLYGFGPDLVNGTIPVTPPVPDASLQYRIVDHYSELPKHACGGDDTSGCLTVTPLLCLIDSATPPPNQSETSCPAIPAHPTRLRVILPFSGTDANVFAQSILLGWDDVPTPSNRTPGVRRFQVRLHQLTINENGAGCCNDGDWRVFVNVGGQWRYMSPFFDTNANGGNGIKAFDGGDNVCEGDALTENGEGDCFRFDNTPWTINVAQDTPIHVGVGGFVARAVEDSDSIISLCRNYPGGCDPPSGLLDNFDFIKDLALNNDDRIGTYEFDLLPPADPFSAAGYSPPAAFTTAQFDCTVVSIDCQLQYKVEFTVTEVAPSTPPASAALDIGTPHYVGSGGTYITSATALTLTPATASSNFQYRFHLQGGSLPTYASTLPFPVHWTSAVLPAALSPVSVYLAGVNAAGDGAYDFQYSAEKDSHLLEPRHTQPLILDTTPPVATIVTPAAGAQYGHNVMLTIDYGVSDGTGSGVKSAIPKMDNSTTLSDGTPVADGLTINALTEMTLGSHTFSVDSADNVNNAGTNAVTFSIVVTPESLKGDVTEFLTLGCIDKSGIGQSLIAEVDAAKNLIGQGQLQAAINILAAFINDVQAQAGRHISTSCSVGGHLIDAAQILIGDAQYLQSVLAAQLKA